MPFTVQDLIEGPPAPVKAKPNEPAKAALDRMFEHDFSQLPVVDAENKPQGVVTGESILRAMSIFEINLDRLRVLDATVKAQSFRNDANLFDLLDAMRDTYTVLIVDGDQRLSGIVTSYDTTEYFRRRAEDIMLVEDIETTLKDYIQAAFPETKQTDLDLLIQHMTDSDKTLRQDFFKALKHYLGLDPDLSGKVQVQDSLGEQVFTQHLATKPKKKGFDDLTLHQYIELFLHNDTWTYCSTIFELDRQAIRHLLHEVRKIRNDLAHFRAEISATQREKLHFCAEWLARHQTVVANVLTEPLTSVPIAPTQPSISEQPLPDIMVMEEEPDPQSSRYASLAVWLQSRPTTEDRVQLSFQEIEEIMGTPLPDSARQHRSWWPMTLVVTSRLNSSSMWAGE
jgi:CBS domain-containing protein